MARGVLTPTVIVREGVAPPAQTNADATNKHYIAPNDGHIMFEVISSDAGTQTVTIKSGRTIDGLALADLVISIPAGATRMCGPFASGTFNQTYNDGAVDHVNAILIDPSVSTNLKFRVYQLPSPTRIQ